jgi:hypothetical protein
MLIYKIQIKLFLLTNYGIGSIPFYLYFKMF